MWDFNTICRDVLERVKRCLPDFGIFAIDAIVQSADNSLVGDDLEIGQGGETLFGITMFISIQKNIRSRTTARNPHPLLACKLDQPWSLRRDLERMWHSWIYMSLLFQVLIRQVAYCPLIIFHLHLLESFDRPWLVDPGQPVNNCPAEHNICQRRAFLEHGITFHGVICQGFSGSPAKLVISLEEGATD